MTVPTPLPFTADNTSFESIYRALRATASRYLRSEHNAQSMSPTVLVHEAWVAISKSQTSQVHDKAHYIKLVGRVMKNLLVDHARRKHAVVRGGDMERVEWTESVPGKREDSEMILAVADALEKLALQSPELASIVELRYFGGFTEAEVASILDVHPRTVRRQWQVARLRLLEVLQ